MNFEEKLAIARKELVLSGLWKSDRSSPVLNFLWKRGVKVRPIQYYHAIVVFLSQMILFSLVWGLPMWFFVWQFDETPLRRAVVICLVTGALYGLLITIFMMWGVRRKRLSKWRDLKSDLNQNEQNGYE